MTIYSMKFSLGKAFEDQTFNLCEHSIVQSDAPEAVEILGREGKWVAEAVGTEAWEASVTAYSTAYTKTMQFFRGRNLIPSDIEEVRVFFFKSYGYVGVINSV